jgi:prepilin-type N-terminal cleavage/methylation domain-containing protein
MSIHTTRRPSSRTGFSLLELLIVLVIMGVVAGLTVPKLNLSTYRVDAIAQQVRSVFQTSQRTSLTRQYDVIISIDTFKHELRIAEDADNSGTIEPGEVRFWRPTGQVEGNIFSVPPRGFSTPVVTTSVVGSGLKKIDNLPSIIFHRNGSASTNAEIYVANASKRDIQYRLITLTRSTGRTDMYRLSGTGMTARWLVVR